MENDSVLLDAWSALSIRSCYNMVGPAGKDCGDFFRTVHPGGRITSQSIFGTGLLVESAEKLESGIEGIAQGLRKMVDSVAEATGISR